MQTTIDSNDKNLALCVMDAVSNGIVFTRVGNPKDTAAIKLYSVGLLKLVHSCGWERTYIPACVCDTNELYACYIRMGGTLTEKQANRAMVWDLFDFSAYAGTSLHTKIATNGGAESCYESMLTSGFNII